MITPFTPIHVNAGEPFATTFAAFVADNETICAEEAAEIREALEAGRVYYGGGGAAAGWSVSLQPGAPDCPPEAVA